MKRNLIILAVCVLLSLLLRHFTTSVDYGPLETALLIFGLFGLAMLVIIIVEGIRDFIKTKKIPVRYFILLAACLLPAILIELPFGFLPIIWVTLALFGLVMLVIIIVKGIRDIFRGKGRISKSEGVEPKTTAPKQESADSGWFLKPEE